MDLLKSNSKRRRSKHEIAAAKQAEELEAAELISLRETVKNLEDKNQAIQTELDGVRESEQVTIQ